MGAPAASLFVSVSNERAIIKIVGRGNFSVSVCLKTLLTELRGKGCRHFVFDLSECATMDSTFLGVLAGLAVQLSNGGATTGDSVLELHNPNARIVDLLENLGVSQYFSVAQSTTPLAANFRPLSATDEGSKQEVSRTCLEAHQTLMEINPENVPKFKDVAQFLAEEIKRSKA